MGHIKSVILLCLLTVVLLFSLYHGKTAFKDLNKNVDLWSATVGEKFLKQ
jgi:hypothetical protein